MSNILNIEIWHTPIGVNKEGGGVAFWEVTKTWREIEDWVSTTIRQWLKVAKK